MGILPCISYGGIEKTCPQYQDAFQEARSGSRWTAQGIQEGLRGKDLFPSLMRDFGAWMCMRPDMFDFFLLLSFVLNYALKSMPIIDGRRPLRYPLSSIKSSRILSLQDIFIVFHWRFF